MSMLVRQPSAETTGAPFRRHPFIVRLARFTTFSTDDLNRLERIIDGEKIIKKRKDLIVDGCEYRSLCFVKAGHAIRYKLLRNGRRQILGVILPGDVVGFPVSLFDRSTYSVVALSDVTANVCSIDSYAQLCFQRPQFGLALSWLAAEDAAIYAEHIVNVGRRTPVERLAHFLLETHARLLAVGLAGETHFELPVSQEGIADVLGLSVPHLNRMMQQLRKDGHITNHGHLVAFSDIANLQTFAHYQPLNLTPIPIPPSGTEVDGRDPLI